MFLQKILQVIFQYLWTRIFHVLPHSIGETHLFICERFIFEKKLESPLILFFILKGK